MITAVIITLNEAGHIASCISSVFALADEVIVIDTGSHDDTVVLAKSAGAKVHNQAWKGYGHARNQGATFSNNDWILSLDADERIDLQMIETVKNTSLDHRSVYLFKRKNIYRDKEMSYGMLRPEWKARLYHRQQTSWDSRNVHEQLSTENMKLVRLKGHISHYVYQDYNKMRSTLDHYARLTARQWQEDGYHPNAFVRHVGPYFHFIKTYFFKLGILEGKYGYETSKAAFRYSRRKYGYLRKDD